MKEGSLKRNRGWMRRAPRKVIEAMIAPAVSFSEVAADDPLELSEQVYPVGWLERAAALAEGRATPGDWIA